MVRKIGKKVKKNKIDNQMIDNQIDKGLEFIYNYCGKEIYEVYYDLSLSTSLILTQVLTTVNEAYRMASINNNKRRNSLLNGFIGHAKGLIQEYDKEYTPSPVMRAFYSLFIINQYIGEYIEINHFKNAFKEDNLKNVNEHQKLFIKSRYEKFEKESKDYFISKKYDVAFNDDYKNKFNNLSVNLSKILDILLKETERYYPQNGIARELNESINKFQLEIDGIEYIKNTQEYDLLNKIVKLTCYSKAIIYNEYFEEYLLLLHPHNKETAKEKVAMVKALLQEIMDFIEEFSELAIYGETGIMDIEKTA